MRKLTPKQKARAAECLGMAFSHFRTAQTLIKSKEYAFAVRALYYAAFFAAQAACLEHGRTSKKHSYWIGLFNKKFGKGRRWMPKLYPKLLIQLSKEREQVDYHGTLANDEALATARERTVDNLLKKVRNNTSLLLYPEFIENFLEKNDDVVALEFDFYCPKSYIHKERIQFQIQAEKYDLKYFKKMIKAAKTTVVIINASRRNDYVLGWNNRLGQSGDGYLLFLDIDEQGEGKVRSALKDKKGWLFKSGWGFHFVGSEILPSKKLWLHKFQKATRSKKLKNLIDARHVDFSIRRGYSTLRITHTEIKDFVPFMCWNNSK